MSLSTRKGSLRVRGKGRDGGKLRELPLTRPELRTALTNWLDQRPSWPHAQDSPALLLNRRGGRLSDRAARTIITDLGEHVGLGADTPARKPSRITCSKRRWSSGSRRERTWTTSQSSGLSRRRPSNAKESSGTLNTAAASGTTLSCTADCGMTPCSDRGLVRHAIGFAVSLTQGSSYGDRWEVRAYSDLCGLMSDQAPRYPVSLLARLG